MSEQPESSHAGLEELARLFQGDEGTRIVRRHGGVGPVPGRFELLKSGGAAALLETEDGSPVALCAYLSDEDGSPEIIRLDPSRDRGLRGRRLLRKAKRLTEFCAPFMSLERQELVAYHPERRAVVRLEGRSSDGAPAVFFAKLLRRKAFERASRLHEGLRYQAGHGGLVMPVLESKEHSVLVFPQAPGSSLHELLVFGERIDFPALVDGIGRLQEVEPPEGLGIHDFEAEKYATLKMLDRGRVVVPELDSLWQTVSEIDMPVSYQGVFCHRDLHDKQVFLRAEAAGFIDFEGAMIGPPFLDAVNLAEHCRLRELQGRVSGGSEIGRIILDKLGFDARVHEIKVITALTRARLAGVYAARPRWKTLSLTLARSALEQLREAS